MSSHIKPKNLVYLYTTYMSIGAKIRIFRKKLNLSGTEFGDLCDVTKGMVSIWESDKNTPSISAILKLRENLRENNLPILSLDWLYGADDQLITLHDQDSKQIDAQQEAIKLLSKIDQDDADVWLATVKAAANKERKKKQAAADTMLAQSRAAQASQKPEEVEKELPKQPSDPPTGTRRIA